MQSDADAGSLATALLHAKNLNHPDKDVDKVQLEADRLGKRITLSVTSSNHLCVLQDALSVIKHKGTKDSQTTVERERLGDGKGAEGGTREDHGCQR